ncbi:hypothetical protein G6L37_05100 [Agrobacterium rubi]|nr:hypothetical protein [Agrobacterium rubi]NTF24733.1 hypothetical protein [Agrobacterium rubi]
MKRPRNLMDGYYVLDGKSPRPVTDIMEWGQAFEHSNRVVALTQTDLYTVSTVFLGISHGQLRNGPPHLFETMVFTSAEYDGLVPSAESLNATTCRYPSWDDAEAGHATQVRRLERQVEVLVSRKVEAATQRQTSKAGHDGD